MDGATGLTYMQQRYYDPQIGRFLSVDPITPSGKTGGNFSRYWYANNNPFRFTDPDGREAEQNWFDAAELGTFHEGAKNYTSPKGVYTISAHGWWPDPARYIKGPDGKPWSAEKVWNYIKKDYLAGGYSSIQVAACGAGMPDETGRSFADDLTQISGASVAATENLVGYPEDGNIFIGRPIEGTVPLQTQPIPGATWKQHTPYTSAQKGAGKEQGFQGNFRVGGKIDSMRLKHEMSGK